MQANRSNRIFVTWQLNTTILDIWLVWLKINWAATKWLCAQWRLRSAWASAQYDQTSLCAQWVAKDPSFLRADSEDSDQTGLMPRLIWVFAGRTLSLLLLSYRGSISSFKPKRPPLWLSKIAQFSVQQRHNCWHQNLTGIVFTDFSQFSIWFFSILSVVFSVLYVLKDIL